MANSASSYTINTMHYPSTTNLHTHGRVDPEFTVLWLQRSKLKCDEPLSSFAFGLCFQPLLSTLDRLSVGSI